MALDASISIGLEATYGAVAAGPMEGYEGKGDSWKTDRQVIESVGFRAGMQTARADRRNTINMGGEGELEVDVLSAGAGSLLSAAFDKTDVDSLDGLIVRTYTSDAMGVASSFSAQMVRPTVDGSRVAYMHVGCVATEWELTAEVESAVSLNVKFDFQDVTHTTVPGSIRTPVYPAAATYVYDWSTAGVVIQRANGATADINAASVTVSGERGMKTDRRFLKVSPLKAKPVRSALPTYSGEISGEFSMGSLGLYEAFLAGEVCSLQLTVQGHVPGTSLTMALPAIQFTGDSPEASVDDLTAHKLPFRVLDPGTGDPAVTLAYVEVDPNFVEP